MAEVQTLIFKCILIGDSQTGKSTILKQFFDGEFKENSQPTVGVEFGSKMVQTEHKKIKLQIWDTSGQEKYRQMLSSYYKDSRGVFLVFDFSNRQTFENLDHWFKKLQENPSENRTVILIGNKSDLIDTQSVTVEEARKYAAEKNVDIYEISSKQQPHIDLIFNRMTEQFLSQTE